MRQCQLIFSPLNFEKFVEMYFFLGKQIFVLILPSDSSMELGQEGKMHRDKQF